jgi:hypothetical protein
MYKYPTANSIQKATAATGFLRNWSNETGNALGFTFGAVIIQ